MATLLDEFVALINEFNVREIPFAVCGGWAVAVHGFPRFTTDIDFLILTDDLDRCKDVLRLRGFDIEGLPLNFDKGRTQIRRISRVDQKTHALITVDLLLVTEYMTPAWDQRQRVKWEKGDYSVVSPRGLILMKQNTGREKDKIDIDFLRGLVDENDD